MLLAMLPLSLCGEACEVEVEVLVHDFRRAESGGGMDVGSDAVAMFGVVLCYASRSLHRVRQGCFLPLDV